MREYAFFLVIPKELLRDSCRRSLFVSLSSCCCSSQFPNHGSNQDPAKKKKEKRTEDETASSALMVGAALAGTALLAIGAWSLSSSSESTENKAHEIGAMNRAGLTGAQQEGGHAFCGSAPRFFRIMSYIGKLIQKHSPDIILFQEVTPLIYQIFQSSQWWELYKCFSPQERDARQHFCMLLSKFPVERFNNVQLDTSTMEREICVAELKVGSNNNLAVASGHLKSPNPLELNTEKRQAQAIAALKHLDNFPNAIFGGDMNWNEDFDGHFPLYGSWFDPWDLARPAEKGWTYDTKENQSLRGNRPLQKRLDRFVCKLRDFKIIDIKMIGMEAIPDTSFCHKKKENPVYPSDHFGLLLTISNMAASLCLGSKGRKLYLRLLK